MTREAFEAALDAGHLWTAIRGYDTRWYRCRRNGRTRTWKRDPSRFLIPVKFRLKDCMRVQDHDFTMGVVDKWFHIGAEAPNREVTLP